MILHKLVTLLPSSQEPVPNTREELEGGSIIPTKPLPSFTKERTAEEIRQAVINIEEVVRNEEAEREKEKHISPEDIPLTYENAQTLFPGYNEQTEAYFQEWQKTNWYGPVSEEFLRRKFVDSGAFEEWKEIQDTIAVGPTRWENLKSDVWDGVVGGTQFTTGFAKGVWTEIESYKDLLDPGAYVELVKAMGTGIETLWKVGDAVGYHGFDVLKPIATEVANALGVEIENLDAAIEKIKNEADAHKAGILVGVLAASFIPLKKLKAGEKIKDILAKLNDRIKYAVNNFKVKNPGFAKIPFAKDITEISGSFIDARKITRENIRGLIEWSEALNGKHIEGRHIAKSQDYLKDRLENNITQELTNGLKKAQPATSFHDWPTAEKALRDALQSPEGVKKLKQAINKSRSGDAKVFQPFVIKNAGADLGYGYKPVNGLAENISQKLTDIEIRLELDGNGGFKVNSFFPVINQ